MAGRTGGTLAGEDRLPPPPAPRRRAASRSGGPAPNVAAATACAPAPSPVGCPPFTSRSPALLTLSGRSRHATGSRFSGSSCLAQGDEAVPFRDRVRPGPGRRAGLRTPSRPASFFFVVPDGRAASPWEGYALTISSKSPGPRVYER